MDGYDNVEAVAQVLDHSCDDSSLLWRSDHQWAVFTRDSSGDDLKIWWRHNMETIYAIPAFCEWNPTSLVDFPYKGQVMLSLDEPMLTNHLWGLAAFSWGQFLRKSSRYKSLKWVWHYIDVIMTTIASQITSLMVVYSIVYSCADQRKHQSSASLAFVRGIHRDRWIPRTKGQLRGKCFHLMTSSWKIANCL